jgi:hypothetical protein
VNSGNPTEPPFRVFAIGVLALIGFAQMAGDLLHMPALKGIAAATGASPAPKVFSAVKGLETFSTRFFIEWIDATGALHSVEITPERYALLRGPYNRRNVYGAVLAYGPVLKSDPRTRPMFDAVSTYALCGEAPLLRELGILDEPRGSLRIRMETQSRVAPSDLPLVLRPSCP